MKEFPYKQSFRLISAHALACFVIFIFGILIFAGLITNNVGSIVFSTIATLIYFISIYNHSYKIAQKDKKSYTPEQPYMFKGLVLAVGIFAVSIILYALYFVAWKFMTINDALISVSGWINNFLFIIWTFPFTGFIKLSNGDMTWYGYIIVAAIPFIASFLGYFAGYKNFDLYSKFLSLVYENKEKNK